jgi:hypothetical protein
MGKEKVDLVGSLSAMSFADLMQWAHSARKTGRLVFERDRVNRRIFLREGAIIACDADDPPLLLGQFLISHGQITENNLRDAMQFQESTGKHLGQIFIELGVVTDEQLQRCVLAKAEETIYGLFEWHDATFRYDSTATPGKTAIRVDLDITVVLLEGARRQDEINEIRKIFNDSRMILIKTDQPPDQHFIANTTAKRLYDAIDGKRTLNRLLLESHAPEFLAYSFLLQLYQRGTVQIGGLESATAVAATPEASIERIRDLVNHEEYRSAIEMIEILRSDIPNTHESKLLVARAESGFIAQMYSSDLPPNATPCLTSPDEPSGTASVSDREQFLLELIDGAWNIRELVWIAPMRKVEVVSGLLSLLQKGFIELRLSEPAGGNAADSKAAPALTQS